MPASDIALSLTHSRAHTTKSAWKFNHNHTAMTKGYSHRTCSSHCCGVVALVTLLWSLISLSVVISPPPTPDPCFYLSILFKWSSRVHHRAGDRALPFNLITDLLAFMLPLQRVLLFSFWIFFFILLEGRFKETVFVPFHTLLILTSALISLHSHPKIMDVFQPVSNLYPKLQNNTGNYDWHRFYFNLSPPLHITFVYN